EVLDAVAQLHRLHGLHADLLAHDVEVLGLRPALAHHADRHLGTGLAAHALDGVGKLHVLGAEPVDLDDAIARVQARPVGRRAADPPSDSVSTTSNAPVTNAFFMESPWPPLSAPLAEPLLGILGLALEAHLEVEARPFQRARVPDRSNPLALPHVVALLHEDVGDVRVERVVLVVVIENDQIAVALEPARVDDAAAI